jgi:hypothetical protein
MLEHDHPRMLFFFQVVPVAGVAVALGRPAPLLGELSGEQQRKLVVLLQVAVMEGEQGLAPLDA